MSHRAVIAYRPDFRRYDFGPEHPLRPERIDAGFDLLKSAGMLHDSEILQPQAARRTELELAHTAEYISTIELAGATDLRADTLARYGLSSGDNPPFPDMHLASALVTGGSTEPTRLIMRGEIDHAFNPAGGLHHASASRASGFCIYNDPAVAAAVAVEEFGARVLYVDFDCHHGDGVQWIFYRDPRVMTLSFHESGRYLFPGTGSVEERGEGPGEGYSLNVPFMPFSQDGSWLDAAESILPAAIAGFRPDLIISSHGADTHLWDPLTHLALTTRSFTAQAHLVHTLAHEYAAGRWLAVGSGGYDWRRVVPRSWSIVWAEMTGRALPQRLPPDWRARWDDGELPMPVEMTDIPELATPVARRAEIDRENSATVQTLLSEMKLVAGRSGISER